VVDACVWLILVVSWDEKTMYAPLLIGLRIKVGSGLHYRLSFLIFSDQKFQIILEWSLKLNKKIDHFSKLN
jgi:hypothetical protein